MNAVREYYADYVMPDGLIEKTTFYAEPEYTMKSFVKEAYKHRKDKLIEVKVKYSTEKIETTEYFNSGRKDCLKGSHILQIFQVSYIKLYLKIKPNNS